MRVAVCLSGELRGCDECLRLLQLHIIKPFEDKGAKVDLFMHTRKDPWWEPACKLNFRCLWVEENRHRDITSILSKANPMDRGERGGEDRRAFLYQSYMQQYYSLQAVGAMKLRAEQQDGKKYDWVVRSRPDCYLKHPLPVDTLQPDCLSMPWNGWHPYEINGVRYENCNDRFAVGPSHLMDVYFNKFTHLQAFCSRYEIRGEPFTAWHLDNCGVKWLRCDKIELLQTDLLYKYSLRPDEVR